jgi:hypothetical protein
MTNNTRIAGLVSTLSKLNPFDPEVAKVTHQLAAALESMSLETEVDPEALLGQVQKLHQAATVPASNYNRIAGITSGLARAIEISRRPQFAALRPRIATIVAKVAGIFAEVDLADEISAHTLEEIESAVHRLYSNGALNKPSTYNFQARGKGHHSES